MWAVLPWQTHKVVVRYVYTDVPCRRVCSFGGGGEGVVAISGMVGSGWIRTYMQAYIQLNT